MSNVSGCCSVFLCWFRRSMRSLQGPWGPGLQKTQVTRLILTMGSRNCAHWPLSLEMKHMFCTIFGSISWKVWLSVEVLVKGHPIRADGKYCTHNRSLRFSPHYALQRSWDSVGSQTWNNSHSFKRSDNSKHLTHYKSFSCSAAPRNPHSLCRAWQSSTSLFLNFPWCPTWVVLKQPWVTCLSLDLSSPSEAPVWSLKLGAQSQPSSFLPFIISQAQGCWVRNTTQLHLPPFQASSSLRAHCKNPSASLPASRLQPFHPPFCLKSQSSWDQFA